MWGPRRATSPSCILQHPGIFPGGRRTAQTDLPAGYQPDDCPALGSYTVWVLGPLPWKLGNSHDREKSSALCPHPSSALSRLCDLEWVPSLSYEGSAPPGSCLKRCCPGHPCSSADLVFPRPGLGHPGVDNTPQVSLLSPKPADHPGQPTAHSTSAQPCAKCHSFCPMTLSLRTAVATYPVEGHGWGSRPTEPRLDCIRVCFRPSRGVQRLFQPRVVGGCGDGVRSARPGPLAFQIVRPS